MILFALVMLGIFVLVVLGLLNHWKEQRAISAYEIETGQQWLRPGKTNKGGHNGPPRAPFDRPPPPGKIKS